MSSLVTESEVELDSQLHLREFVVAAVPVVSSKQRRVQRTDWGAEIGSISHIEDVGFQSKLTLSLSWDLLTSVTS